MKNLKKYVGVLMLLTLLVGFTSCEDDETIFDHIMIRLRKCPVLLQR